MANCQKYNKATCGHMFKHYERAKVDGEYIKFHNQNIDTSRSHLNYNLAPKREINQGEFIKQRCNEVYCLNRKDVNVMCSWVITAPQDLSSKEYKNFFKSAYEFMSNRYGQENVISSYVHMDEVTPHMHFAFVPVTYDCKKERLKVSAKDVINRTELQIFHKKLQTHVEQILGHNVSILNEATIDGNKSIDQLKRETALEAKKSISKAHLLEQAYENKAKALKTEYNAILAFLKNNDSKISKEMYPPEVQIIEKGFLKKEKYVQVPQKMWEAVWVSADKEQQAYRTMNELEKTMFDFQEKIRNQDNFLNNHIEELKYKIKQLENDKKQLRLLLKKSDKEFHDLKKRFEITMDWIHSDKSFVDSYYDYKNQLEEKEKVKQTQKIKNQFRFQSKSYGFER